MTAPRMRLKHAAGWFRQNRAAAGAQLDGKSQPACRSVLTGG